jgi:16S rRNA (guanine(966)-N(2))-methyltransferase RsmD
MRVIAGTAKGVQLKAVPGSTTRPISDRVKQALFNILAAEVPGARVLDLFAGTGSVGIEALSRHAAEAVLVEKNPRAVATIKENLSRTRLQAKATVVRADVFTYLSREPSPFDLIYVAPPQYQGLWSKTLLVLDAKSDWLCLDGQIVVQIFPKELEALNLSTLELADQRKYGSTLLCFFEHLAP